MLPAGTLLHRQDYFLEQPFVDESRDVVGEKMQESFLTQSYLKHFSGRGHLKHEAYLFISMLNTGLMKNFLGSSLINPSGNKKKVRGQREKLEETQDNVMEQLRQGGVSSFKIIKDELLILMERYLSMNFNAKAPVLGSLDFRDHLKVMDSFVEIYGLNNYDSVPEEVKPMSAQPMTGLPVSMIYPVTYGLSFSHITNCFLYMGNQTEIKSNLESSQKKIYSLSKFSAENKLNAKLIQSFLEAGPRGWSAHCANAF